MGDWSIGDPDFRSARSYGATGGRDGPGLGSTVVFAGPAGLTYGGTSDGHALAGVSADSFVRGDAISRREAPMVRAGYSEWRQKNRDALQAGRISVPQYATPEGPYFWGKVLGPKDRPNDTPWLRDLMLAAGWPPELMNRCAGGEF